MFSPAGITDVGLVTNQFYPSIVPLVMDLCFRFVR